jgi:hypothetical protein
MDDFPALVATTIPKRPEYVAEMLGHARLETTQRYTRVSIDRLRIVRASAHPAAGLGVAMAPELCAVLPQGGLGVGIAHKNPIISARITSYETPTPHWSVVAPNGTA